MDSTIIKEFQGTHPKIMQNWLPKSTGLYKTDPNYTLSKKQKKHRLMIGIENFFGLELSKKHFKLI